ncbi:MAG: YHS domain-containing protein [Proteobacteria bacterium]|nr:YHS domain-containing protein [Pseudomonadota bacterium]
MTSQEKNQVVDPVCGARLDPGRTPRQVRRGSHIYYFCSPECMARFNQNSGRYLKGKGFIARFIDRLARAGRREYGSGRPCCHG